MRNTKQKQDVLTCVRSMHTHPTADEIYTVLRAKTGTLSLGTVYRNLNRFAESGKVKKVSVPGGSDRFDGRLDEHEHFFCEKCGRVSDVEFSNNVFSMLSKESETELTGYNLMLYGVCNECATTKKK